MMRGIPWTAQSRKFASFSGIRVEFGNSVEKNTQPTPPHICRGCLALRQAAPAMAGPGVFRGYTSQEEGAPFRSKPTTCMLAG